MSAERIEDLLAEFVERVESGESIDPETFAGLHPEAGAELLAGLERLVATEALFPASAGELPRRIGRYRVLGEIGRGGMGRVLEVEPEGSRGERLALKLLTTAAWLSPRAVERLRREGRVLEKLRHPGIVRVVDVGVADGTPFVAMERLPGPSLAEFVRTARAATGGRGVALADRLELPGSGPGVQRAARVAARVARAAAAAHRERLLHRDIKPGNVLLDDGGDPVLIDFGLAADAAGSTLTRTGDVLGTPHYMAPEQALGEKATERSDVYSLGAVLYELLALRPPHEGVDPLSVLERVRSAPVTPLRRIDPRVPRALETIVMRAMACTPARRYPSAEALAGDLEAFAAGRPIAAGRPGPVERAAGLWRFQRGRLSLAATLALVAALLVIALRPWSTDPEIEAGYRDALEAAAMAWVAEDRGALHDAAGRMLALVPGDDVAAVLRAEAQGVKPAPPVDPGAAALAAGFTALRQGRAGEALSPLARAVVLLEGSPLPVVVRGIAAWCARRWDVAEGELTAAVRVLPRSARLWHRLANVYMEQEDRAEDARDTLRKAAQMAPEDWTIRRDLALVHLALEGRRPETERDYRKALASSSRAMELAGEAAPDRLRRIHATALDGAGRREEAQAILRMLIAKDPTNAADHYRLGFSLDYQHRTLEALHEYRRALEIDPRLSRPAILLSFLYAGARRPERCRECLRFYREHPEYLNPDLAERYALQALRASRGRVAGVVETAVRVARQIGRRDAILGLLRELRDDAHQQEKKELFASLSEAIYEIERD